MKWENKIVLSCYSVYVCSNCGAEIQVKHNEKLPCYCKNCESECEEQSAEMTTEKLETAVKNMNCIIEELRNDDDTFTITIKVLKSIKANYEELINLRAEIERQERHTEMYHELRAEAIKEYMKILEEKLSQNTDISNVGYQSIILDMEQGYKEMAGADNV